VIDVVAGTSQQLPSTRRDMAHAVCADNLINQHMIYAQFREIARWLSRLVE
jgi:hypothetical protein